MSTDAPNSLDSVLLVKLFSRPVRADPDVERRAVLATLATLAVLAVAVLVSLFVRGSLRDAAVTASCSLAGAAIGAVVMPAFLAYQRDVRRVTAAANLDSLLSRSEYQSILANWRITPAVLAGRNQEVDELADLRFTVVDTPRADDQMGVRRLLRDELLPLLRAEAAERGVTFNTEEQGVDVVDVAVMPPSPASPRRTYRFTVTPVTYGEFAVTANALDRDLSRLPSFARLLGRDMRTARHLWAAREPRSILDVASLPAPAKIGTVTVVITSDHQIFGMVRGRRLYQAAVDPTRSGRTPIHFVGEGAQPGDGHEAFTPRATSYRGSREELALLQDVIAAADFVLATTGLGLDLDRWQPVFCYLALVPLPFAHLRELAVAGPDFGLEVEGVAPFEWSIHAKATRELIRNEHDQYVLASNHAWLALVAALAYRHGLAQVMAAML